MSAGARHSPCRVVSRGKQVELRSDASVFVLDTEHGLRAEAWENRLSGQTLRFAGGQELDCDLDAAVRRIPIVGWKIASSDGGNFPADDDPGHIEGYHHPEFDDSEWSDGRSPGIAFGMSYASAFQWARTSVFLPEGCEQESLSLLLGGVGLFDFGFMRVFLNGQLVSIRETEDRWHEPGVVELGPASDARACVRFGQDNIIALQLGRPLLRTKRLDELDPRESLKLGHAYTWPAQFEQYLVVGQSVQRLNWDVVRCSANSEGETGEAAFDLADADQGLEARVIYRWNAGQPTLHKAARLTNVSGSEVRLMNVRLGDYQTPGTVSDGEQGFPVYVDMSFFLTLAHPAKEMGTAK